MFQFMFDTAQVGIAANDHGVRTQRSDEHPGIQHPFGISTSNHRIYPLETYKNLRKVTISITL